MAVRIPLTKLASNVPGRIVEIQGGRGFQKRLESMGLRIGQSVEKVSGPFMRGPVTLRAGNIRVALGFGAAGKVIVEIKG